MSTPIMGSIKKRLLVLCMLILLSGFYSNNYAQTFNYQTTEASAILAGDDLHMHGFPDTLITWCNDWDFVTSTSTWGNTILLKSNTSFVKFYVNNASNITRFMTSVSYSYHLAFHIYGFTNPADTIHVYTTDNDTLTINYNNANTPFQNLNLKKYSNFYKLMVIVDEIYADSAGMVVPAILADTLLRTFYVEGSILTQHYDKIEYGSGTSTTQPIVTVTPDPADNYLDLSWSFSTGTVTPINYELEWTYVDDYGVSVVDGSETPIPPSSLSYNFQFNNTRVWLNESDYHIPLIYSRGYIVYRVRAVRPDSSLFEYPVNGQWSLTGGDYGNLGSLTSGYYNISTPYTGDSLNWQYTASFAEGGKYKNVASFYDGLLKNRQSITRFNSNLNKLIVTNNIYDYEGRLCIKTLPAPTDVTSFGYLHNVDLNSATGLPYQAADFDTGSLRYSVISQLDPHAIASVYYSNRNPDTFDTYQRFIPSAEGYPFVQTIFESGYTDRVSAQGGAGPALQIGDSNYIFNSYVDASQPVINSLFGPNVGWANFYTQTVSRDPNQQYSMVIKDYHGKQIASALVGSGPSSATHALNVINSITPVYLTQDLLGAGASGQAIDSIAGTRIADANYFSEDRSVDSLQYYYQFTPYQACPGQYVFVKAHYNATVTDQYGDVMLAQDSVLGVNGVDTSSAPYNYTGDQGSYLADIAPYHVNKTLSFSPGDVTAALDSFFNVANCFLTEPYFIKKSVDSTIFPCVGGSPVFATHDSDECSKMRWQMMQQLFPDAAYAKYTTDGDTLIGTDNSIYTIQGCPTDTAFVTRYYPDSVFIHCYNPFAVMGGDSSVITASEHQWGIVNYRCFCTSLTIPDTCAVDTVYNTTVTITALDLYDSTQSIYFPFVPAFGGMTGNYSIQSNWNLGTLSGDIIAGGVTVGNISQHHGSLHDTTIITLPVSVNGNLFSSNLHANALTSTGDSLLFSFSGLMAPTHVDSLHHFMHPYIYDSVFVNTLSSLCHCRYKDTCTVPSLADTITVNGVLYTGMRTMSADSFTRIYNQAIAAGNYSIAEALLPLHPQYCELMNCFTDTFRNQVLAIPDWHTAQSLGVLYLDSLVAHDPLKSRMTATGFFPSPADSLSTYAGGAIRLDSLVFITAYCACNDSVMARQCYNSMFHYEITHHLLINDDVKSYYFSNIADLYFNNRQRFVDSVLIHGGDSCSHCALARMEYDPTAPILPAIVQIDTPFVSFIGSGTAQWMANLDPDSLASLQDSATASYHYIDSIRFGGLIDTIMAHLTNCIGGDPVIAGNIRHVLNVIHNFGDASSGNFTYDQIMLVLQGCGVPLSDICNPYIFNFSPLYATPQNNCLAQPLYDGIGTFLNDPAFIPVLHSRGTIASAFSLDTVHNLTEQNIARSLGNIQNVDVVAGYDTSSSLYTINVLPSGGGADTVRLLLHSADCGDVFSSITGAYTITASCINDDPSLASGTGLINQYTFIANVAFYLPAFFGGSPVLTSCEMPGWLDSITTMVHRDTAGPHCIPCTQMRELYTEFMDTLQTYGIKGADHPYYSIMLTNFMNDRLQQQYAASDYETFVQSCALADSMLLPLYTGYATFKFAAIADMDTFISRLDSVDPGYNFDNLYRDSAMVAGSPEITVSVDLNVVPEQELWIYKNALNTYTATGTYTSFVINQPFTALQPAGQIGFIYANPSFPFNPLDSNIIDTSTTIKLAGPYQKAVWLGGQFVMQDFYSLIQTGAAPYDVSRAIYTITAYLYNHNIPGVMFVPQYRTTIDADYFKPAKQAYLQYAYGFQGLPDYQVLDNTAAQNLVATIPAYAPYNAAYSPVTTSGLFSNLYLWNAGMNTLYYDTLQHIIDLASPTGAIFNTGNSVSIPLTTAGELNAYICADNSYWYRYFTSGDTLFNVYLAFPAYIPLSLRSSYTVAGPVIPMPGDSLNRYFGLQVVRPGTTDTLLLHGLTSFVIGKSIELDNILLRTSPLSANGGADTFNNCERQELSSAIYNGIVNYNNYLDSVKSAITGAFKTYIVKSVQEKLILGYNNTEQGYTLYNYDRAGNLAFTVPPAGVVPLLDTGTQLNRVDTSRLYNTPTACPAPVYNKMNLYTYTTLNQVNTQTTINGGKTRFMYDAAGRLLFSQNAKQGQTGTYTYNIYDDQNRITETGEGVFGCPYFDPYSSTSPVGAPACSHVYPVDSVTWLITPDTAAAIANSNQVPYSSVVSFIRSFDRDDAVVTIYDTAANPLDTIAGFDAQQNLRKRVSCVKYFVNLLAPDSIFANYDHATHYSYDPQGNVQTLTQDFPRLAVAKRQYIRIDYDYDVISGKVNMLSYNRGAPDQFYQQYSYDADNRITQVQTSNDGYTWTNEAAYTYYDHGPLARVVLGNNIQGMDYAYTIQGWLKALNNDTLNTNVDMGRDGGHNITSIDAVAHAIDYFENDYTSITGRTVKHHLEVQRNLYNGNIAGQTVAIDTFIRLNKRYVYDQLNRIISADYGHVDPIKEFPFTVTDFHSRYTYDFDGNIQTLQRYGNKTSSGALLMDSLHYVYPSIHDDKLADVLDSAADNYTNDIKQDTITSTPGRYQYDAIGNMTRDMVSGQDTIQWNLYNKVVRTVNNTDTSSMQFEYDAAGNRIAKHVIKTSATATTSKDEYYVRDAQGNILATYTGLVKKDLTGLPLYSSLGLAEHDIYGSSRLGMKQYYGLEIGASIDYTTSTIDTARLYDRMPWYSLEYQDVIKTDSVNLYGNKFTNMDFARNVTGQRQYELTDHLGDVLATVSDKRTGSTFAPLTGGGGSPLPGAVARVNSWKPIVISAHDYYPFGSYMPGRYATDTSTGCVLTTISELLPDVYYQTIPIDTLSSAITTHGVTTINYTGGGTVLHMVTALTGSGLRVDLPASESGTHIDVDVNTIIGSHVLRIKDDVTGLVIGAVTYTVGGTGIGLVTIPITTPHSSTVTLVINCTASAGKISLTAIHIPRDTVTAHNIVTTVCNTDFYRYGFNGKMKDNEWAGLGNHLDYGTRNYDPRIARFISVDPSAYKFPNLSPYCYAANNPIFYVDKEGEEPTAAAYRKASEALGIPIATIRAIYLTEVGENAFNDNGKIKILFERHIFSKATGGKYDNSDPDISDPVQGGYGLSSAQYSKFEKAKRLDEEAAYYSVSFSGFQIMGMNYKLAGNFKSAKEFGDKMMNGSEDEHLAAFVSFVKNKPALQKDLKNQDWAAIARIYNGSKYKQNKYDTKLRDGYNKFKDNPLIELDNSGSDRNGKNPNGNNGGTGGNNADGDNTGSGAQGGSAGGNGTGDNSDGGVPCYIPPND